MNDNLIGKISPALLESHIDDIYPFICEQLSELEVSIGATMLGANDDIKEEWLNRTHIMNYLNSLGVLKLFMEDYGTFVDTEYVMTDDEANVDDMILKYNEYEYTVEQLAAPVISYGVFDFSNVHHIILKAKLIKQRYFYMMREKEKQLAFKKELDILRSRIEVLSFKTVQVDTQTIDMFITITKMMKEQ